MKKSYVGYAPKQSNVVKLEKYISTATTGNKQNKENKAPKKGKEKRF
jgi:hypothetical protein